MKKDEKIRGRTTTTTRTTTTIIIIIIISTKEMADLKGKILAGKILVLPQEAETKTASGIIIPDSAKEKPQQGKVVAVGKGTKDEPMTVKIGDTVLYGKFAGTELKLDGNDYLIMRESDIFAIL